METTAKYENYPAWIVVLADLVSLGIYTLGFYIMLKVGWSLALVYLGYALFFEFRLIRFHCTNCFYWGKTCGFGKGRLSRLFFKKGNPASFCARKMTWSDILPDLLISLVPFIIGVVLLVLSFEWILLFSLILLLFLTTSGNGFIRGKLSCSHCKQAEIGCPALDLFNKGK